MCRRVLRIERVCVPTFTSSKEEAGFIPTRVGGCRGDDSPKGEVGVKWVVAATEEENRGHRSGEVPEEKL